MCVCVCGVRYVSVCTQMLTMLVMKTQVVILSIVEGDCEGWAFLVSNIKKKIHRKHILKRY